MNALLILALATANAANPTVDMDGDGAVVMATGYSGITIPADQLDCDDSNPNRFPGNTEIYNDGIDQDCDGNDAKLPVSDQAYAWFVAGEYNGSDPGFARFVAEYDNCQVSPGCDVVSGQGQGYFEVSEGYTKQDIWVQGTRILRADGNMDFPTLEEASHYRPATVAAYSGPNEKRRKAEAREELQGDLDALTEADAQLAADLAANGAADLVRDAEHNKLVVVVNGVVEDLDDVRAQAAKAQRTATAAKRQAGEAARRSTVTPWGGAFVGAGLHTGQTATLGKQTLRNSAFFGASLGGVIGLEGEGILVTGFADYNPGADGADTTRFMAYGSDVLFDAGDNWRLGFNAMGTNRLSMRNGLETDAHGLSGMGGFTAVRTLGQSDKGGMAAWITRIDVGAEHLSITGAQVNEGWGGSFRFQSGFVFGLARPN